MSVKMNFGNLKYAIGSSRASKLSKSRGPTTNTEQTSTINLSTKSNVENLLARKNLQLRPKTDKSEKLIESATNIGIKTIPLAGKNSKNMDKIQFVTQIERTKEREREIYQNNLNTNPLSSRNKNSNSLPRKESEKQVNILNFNRGKHQKTSSEIPKNLAITNYIYDNFYLSKNHLEMHDKSKELTDLNSQRNKLPLHDIYNNTTNTFNRDKEEFDPNNGVRLKNVFVSLDNKNESNSIYGKFLNSDKKENKFLNRNVNVVKSEKELNNTNHVNTEGNIVNVNEKKIFQDKFKNPNVNANLDANVNINVNEQIVMNKELTKTVEILKTYIKTAQSVSENKKLEYQKKLLEKEKEINRIKLENQAIKKQNNELKMKMLQILNNVKIYELDEINREKTINNTYLRCSNEKVLGLHHAKDHSAQQIRHNINEKEEKEKSLNKINHKRQKTQINFTNTTFQGNSESDLKDKSKSSHNSTVLKDTNSSVNTNRSDDASVIGNTDKSFSSNSVNKEDDAFSSAFRDMQTNHSNKKTMTEENKTEDSPMFILSPTANNQKHKPSYLFYRTPDLLRDEL